MFRAYFQLPRTDPRYLAATDLDMLQDLLEAMYQAGATRRALDPDLAAMEEALRDPESAASFTDLVRAELQPGGKLLTQLQRFHKMMDDLQGDVPILDVRPQRRESE